MKSSEQPDNQVTQLVQQIALLTARLNKLEKSDRYIFEKNIQLLDGRNFQFGGTNGTKLGVTNSKIGFYGTAPVAQPNAISQPSGGATVDSQARTAINALIAMVHNNGLTK